MSPARRRRPHLIFGDVTVSREFARAIVGAALQYGIGYWAEVKSASTGERLRLTLQEHETSRHYAITHSNLSDAIRAILAGLDGASGEVLQQVLTGYVDGPRADAIVQVACFGEVKYS